MSVMIDSFSSDSGVVSKRNSTSESNPADGTRSASEKRRSLVNLWDKDAEKYSQNSSLQWRWAMDSLRENPVPSSATVLDIGCGDGKITAQIAKSLSAGHGGSIHGIDIAKEMISFARESFPQPKFPNLTFSVCEALNMNYSNEFNHIVSFSCLSWVDDQLLALQKINSALVTGGKILLVLPGKSPVTLRSFAEELRETGKWKNLFVDYVCPVFYFTVEEYTELLQQAGFSEIKVAQYDSTISFASPQAVIDWLRPISPESHYLAENLREEWISDLVTAYLEKFRPDPETGKISVHWPKLQATAEKSS